jgi:hypothetical protein
VAGQTIIIEFHGWRGFHVDGGPLGRILILGFVSFSYMPFLLSERLKQMIAKLKNVAGDSRGFVEMAAYDEPADNVTTPSFFAKFPRGIHKS